MSKFLDPEDYLEPDCPFCTDMWEGEPVVKSIPVARVIEKADEYFSRNDYDGAERHFLYWIEEAKLGNDLRGRFALCNELVGLYRKVGKKELALERAKEVLALVDKMGINDEIAAGTAFVNVGTAYKAFGLSSLALPYFAKAQAVYEKLLDSSDGRLGGLYNNMALALVDEKRYDEARNYYEKALDTMKNVQFGELERAITLLNMANLAETQYGLENAADEIANLLDEAEKLLDAPAVPRNGYYAFVCEKCAPTFGYYGYFAAEEELKKRARNIYERD